MSAELVGRDEELGQLLAALEDPPAAVLLEGEAGIGKTSIWRAALTELAARGVCVLSTRPAEAESQLSYAGLADLLEPVLDQALGALPLPQRRALEIALQRAEPEGGPPDQAAIAFAVLGALRAASETARVVVAVDDMQWLDAPSVFALAFVAGRLRHEAVSFLLALRPKRGEPPVINFDHRLGEERVRRIRLRPLSLGALNHLLQQRLSVVLSRPTLERVHETSGGNPFFALELARALHLRGVQVPPGEPLPVPSELRELVRARLVALPRDAEEPLLFAAAIPHPTVRLVAEAVGVDPLRSLKYAVDAEVIELDGDRIRFTHPLFASAVYSETERDRRREVHRRLAAVVADSEERARHLALSTEGADEDVASALDDAARIARARGAPQAAAELSELAFRLTPQPAAQAGRRRLDAGAAHFEAGNTARARELFAEVVATAHAGSLRAEALSRLARVHHYGADQRAAVELFRQCLADPRADAHVRVDAADGLATSLFFLREDLAEALIHLRSAARIAEDEKSRAWLAVVLGSQGMIEAVLGRPEAVQTLQSAVGLEEYAREFPLMRQPSFQLAVTRVWSDELDMARADVEDIRRRALAQGDESSLPFTLTYLSLAEYLSGSWAEAMRAASEGAEVAAAAGQEIGRAFALSARALVASGLGLVDEARSDAEEALALAERGAMFATMTSLWAIGILELSLENPAEAHRRLGPLVARVDDADIGEPGSIRFVTDDVEALVALGDLQAAVTQLERFEERTRPLRRRSALAASHRCRGFLHLAAGAAADALAEFDRALDELAPLPLPLERARTLLALGSAQRHARQRRAARGTLEEALRLFDDLGAVLWAERTRRELKRISGRAPSSGELTPAEQRVAELVAEGMTNREVAAALYITPRTVESTLSRVYTKLGVRSRTELARRLTTPHK